MVEWISHHSQRTTVNLYDHFPMAIQYIKIVRFFVSAFFTLIVKPVRSRFVIEIYDDIQL